MPERALPKLEHELGQIDELLSSYKPLLDIANVREPDLTERTALATVLHSFYNGLENIFGIIAKEIDRQFPKGIDWHRSLLRQMAEHNEKRPAVIDEQDRQVLIEYLSFRHFFRHSYSFQLDWEQMVTLVEEMQSNWTRIREKLRTFLSQLGKDK